MSYLGLARKWRPQTFDELVGQPHIAQTIANAIKTNRIAHAYLFTGTRGVGKTSSARIFAKTLRCTRPLKPGIPCSQCEDCIEVSQGHSVDVLEIDGASNNGVDAVREIRENARYLPTRGRYKIYIIDEVHMLTTSAFNALLKTLEEPPEHVIFVLATTDVQKIPITVLSRCQRFDFKRVTPVDLKKRIQHICNEEKIAITEGALHIICKEAEGSMRDGLSLLDQVVAASNQGVQITEHLIINTLGLVDRHIVFKCIDGILCRNTFSALEALNSIHEHGFDLKEFAKELLHHLRQLLMVNALTQQGEQKNLHLFLNCSEQDLEEYERLKSKRTIEELDLLFRVLNFGLEDLTRSQIPKTVFDVLLIKMCVVSEWMDTTQSLPVKNAVSTTSNVSSASSFASSSTLLARTPKPSVEERPVTAVASNDPSELLEVRSSEDWFKLVQTIKKQKPLLGSILSHFSWIQTEVQSERAHFLLGYEKKNSFYKDQLQTKAYEQLLQEMIKNYLGRPAVFEYKEMQGSASQKNFAEDQKQKILQSEPLKAVEQLLGATLEKLEVHS